MHSLLRRRHLSTRDKFLFLIAVIMFPFEGFCFLFFWGEMRRSHIRQEVEVRLSSDQLINKKLFSIRVTVFMRLFYHIHKLPQHGSRVPNPSTPTAAPPPLVTQLSTSKTAGDSSGRALDPTFGIPSIFARFYFSARRSPLYNTNGDAVSFFLLVTTTPSELRLTAMSRKVQMNDR